MSSAPAERRRPSPAFLACAMLGPSVPRRSRSAGAPESLTGRPETPAMAAGARPGRSSSLSCSLMEESGSHMTRCWRKGDSNSRSHPDVELSQCVVLVDICDGDTDGAPATAADRGTQVRTRLGAGGDWIRTFSTAARSPRFPKHPGTIARRRFEPQPPLGSAQAGRERPVRRRKWSA